MPRLPGPPIRRLTSLTVPGKRMLPGAAALPLATAAVVAGLLTPASAGATRPPGPDSMPGPPIKHVIEIMIENHSFDNLFGGFPGADGIPPNTTLLNPNAYYDSQPSVSPVYVTPNEDDRAERYRPRLGLQQSPAWLHAAVELDLR